MYFYLVLFLDQVLLAPGHSLMDWIRLGRTQGDLSGVGPNKRLVTPSELASHNTPKDIWMAIRGDTIFFYFSHSANVLQIVLLGLLYELRRESGVATEAIFYVKLNVV